MIAFIADETGASDVPAATGRYRHAFERALSVAWRQHAQHLDLSSIKQ
ncbi:hypothetical protein [Paraburkholderia sediminicola]|nr:hypothetical protein [Paraburkholderia sediminicola]